MDDGKYHQGYFDCVAETLKFLVGAYGSPADESFKTRLIHHLTAYYMKLINCQELGSKCDNYPIIRRSTSHNLDPTLHTLAIRRGAFLKEQHFPKMASSSTSNFSVSSTDNQNVVWSKCNQTKSSKVNQNEVVIDVAKNKLHNVESSFFLRSNADYGPTKMCNDVSSSASVCKKFVDIKTKFENSFGDNRTVEVVAQGCKRPAKTCDNDVEHSSQSLVNVQSSDDKKPLDLTLRNRKRPFTVTTTNLESVSACMRIGCREGNDPASVQYFEKNDTQFQHHHKVICGNGMPHAGGHRLRTILESNNNRPAGEEAYGNEHWKLNMTKDDLQNKLWHRFHEGGHLPNQRSFNVVKVRTVFAQRPCIHTTYVVERLKLTVTTLQCRIFPEKNRFFIEFKFCSNSMCLFGQKIVYENYLCTSWWVARKVQPHRIPKDCDIHFDLDFQFFWVYVCAYINKRF